jgi:predicted DNA-binding transcriptional regulator YafY
LYGYRSTTRLLSMLELLQARGRIGGPELARKLEVGQRTVRRYAVMLQEMGCRGDHHLREAHGKEGIAVESTKLQRTGRRVPFPNPPCVLRGS